MRYLWCKLVGHNVRMFIGTFYVRCERCGAAVNLRLAARR